MPMQSIAIMVAVLPVVVLIVFGVAALLVRSTWWASVCEVIAHGGALFGGIFCLYFLVPQFKKIFVDLAVELPSGTKILIAISDSMVNYWFLFLPICMSVVTLDVLVFANFHRNPESRSAARILSGLVTVAFIGAAVFVGVTLNGGQSGLMQQLH